MSPQRNVSATKCPRDEMSVRRNDRDEMSATKYPCDEVSAIPFGRLSMLVKFANGFDNHSTFRVQMQFLFPYNPNKQQTRISLNVSFR